jgi:hypothetical protein
MFGLLWVWGEAGPAAWAEAEATPATAAPEDLQRGEWTPKAPWYMR